MKELCKAVNTEILIICSDDSMHKFGPSKTCLALSLGSNSDNIRIDPCFDALKQIMNQFTFVTVDL